jgi:hypothetical protein
VSPIEPLTTLQFVAALRKAGFTITSVTEQRIAMARGEDRHIVVRRHRVLDSADIELLLRAAGMTRQELELHLAGPTRRTSGVALKVVKDPEPESGTGG